MYSVIDVIGALRHRAGVAGLTLYYETVHDTTPFPYAILSDVDRDTTSPHESEFDVTIDFWGESRMELELLCDQVKAALSTCVIQIGTAYGHIIFDRQQAINESEGDLIRRQQRYSVRIFG